MPNGHSDHMILCCNYGHVMSSWFFRVRDGPPWPAHWSSQVEGYSSSLCKFWVFFLLPLSSERFVLVPYCIVFLFSFTSLCYHLRWNKCFKMLLKRAVLPRVRAFPLYSGISTLVVSPVFAFSAPHFSAPNAVLLEYGNLTGSLTFTGLRVVGFLG